MKEYILETRNLSYSYPDGTKALEDVSLQIEKGKKIAIVGVNGSGKSTLFLQFNGVLKPSRGSVLYAGEEVKYSKKDLIQLRKNVGIVFQNPETMLFSSNVFQEVSFGPMNLDLDYEEVKRRVISSLSEVNMLEFQEKSVHFLSYGQKKRVSIADILAMDPQIIILDEPTSSLDPKHAEQIMQLLESLHRRGITILLSTHDVNLAYEWADTVVVMKDGKIVESGDGAKIFSKEDILQECGLRQPYILRSYYELRKRSLWKDENGIPKTEKELFAGLKK